MNSYATLEFNIILQKLADNALSEHAKTRCMALEPSLNEAVVNRWMDETTQARQMIERIGFPPLSAMMDMAKILDVISTDAMLAPEQFEKVLSFIVSCRRMKEYLLKAEQMTFAIATYGRSIDALKSLEDEIRRCIVNGTVSDRASAKLDSIRRQITLTGDQIKEKLNGLLRKNKEWFSESFVSVRNGRYTLPVKREHKKDVSGAVVEISNKGGTCFIEPDSVSRLRSELGELEVEEDGEIRRILYVLSALIADNERQIKLNIEAMETLDFLFAKGKLSSSMKASPVNITNNRKICLRGARHPLLNPDKAVPLDLEIGEGISGIVITGPNTGGKTVALKTLGLLSLMAQSGLHVTAGPDSSFCMNDMVLCDIGDGQSITENLSTFSSHMKNIIAILQSFSRESLILLDELGSGTDPAEGMGIAIGILEALRENGCLFVVTTHYPEVKEYAENTLGLINARMAFDKNSLMPLYRLELGKAGESCALYIAERLGMPEKLLRRARVAAYGEKTDETICNEICTEFKTDAPSKIIGATDKTLKKDTRSIEFKIGDSVIVYPDKKIGIVYAPANGRGEVGVQIKGEKKMINHKRLKLHVEATELYPEDYDFSIVFDSVENRKARHIMEKRHQEGNVIVIKEGNDR